MNKVCELPPPRCFTLDDTKCIHVLQMSPHGAIEHTVTQAFLNAKALEFTRKLFQCRQNHPDCKDPRVCIIGYMDYMWLRAYCADYLRAGITPLPSPPMPENFPNHFSYRGVVCIEGLDSETGFTFA